MHCLGLFNRAAPRRYLAVPWVGLTLAASVGLVIVSLLRPDLALWQAAAVLASAPILLKYPEIALACYVKIGTFKGNAQVAQFLPFDLTLVLGAILAFAILARSESGRPHARLPAIYILYTPILASMAISLAYTPDFAAGLDKTCRFAILTGLAILSPFFLLTSLVQFHRFLATLVTCSLTQALFAISQLGGRERLGSISSPDATIQLGVASAEAIVIILFVVCPTVQFTKRILCYPIIILFVVALVSSGARSATIGLVLALLAGMVAHRHLRLDIVVLAVLAYVTLMFVPVAQASYDYLATLLRKDPVSVLSFRNELMMEGWRQTTGHPLLGVGISGYRLSSPNPGRYNWPHNIILEVSSEIGLPSALCVCCLVGAAFWYVIKRLRKKSCAYRNALWLMVAFLIQAVITMLNTGDLNDNRSLWFYVSVAFVITQVPLEVRRRRVAKGAADEWGH